MDSAMRLERLYKLREMLMSVRRNRVLVLNGKKTYFHMNIFVSTREDTDIEDIPEFCSTASCALGSASLLPWFRRRGLVPEIEQYSVRFKYYYDFEAGAKFFGITEDESYYLFDPHDYYNVDMPHKITPSMVRKRVDRLIKEYGGKV